MGNETEAEPIPGFLSIRSKHSVDATVARVREALVAKSIKLFALIDHSGEAEAAGLSMRPTKLLIFGNPKGGTPLMIARPSVAIDLPLKILVWEDTEGAVWATYNSAAYLAERHHLSADLLPNIAAAELIATQAAR